MKISEVFGEPLGRERYFLRVVRYATKHAGPDQSQLKRLEVIINNKRLANSPILASGREDSGAMMHE
jgi:hypothetical protein